MTTVATNQPYDHNNIFARLLRGEIPANIVAQNEHALAFPDIRPLAPVHVLVIPRGPYTNLLSFSQQASAIEVVEFWKLVQTVAQHYHLDQDGFRLLSNCGSNGGQEVPHFHVHLLGGKALGKMLPSL
ncbi:MAG: HIT domain-containing protein [Alphaproteobacteria bacterium]|nr:HIT domain-containing protein [Alphaproteobacteria bacterium]